MRKLMDMATATNILTVVLAVISLVVLIMPVVIAVFVYRDAEERGMEPKIWMMVAAFLPFCIGLIIYLIKRRQYPK